MIGRGFERERTNLIHHATEHGNLVIVSFQFSLLYPTNVQQAFSSIRGCTCLHIVDVMPLRAVMWLNAVDSSAQVQSSHVWKPAIL